MPENEKNEWLPYNRQKGRPCWAGCIFRRRGDKLILEGDCRAPYDPECYLNKQDEERLNG